jgi:hypothetical protein
VAHGGAVVVQHGWEQWRTISPGVARCIQVEQLDAPAEELPGLNG